jgi:hypothetical protein
MVRFPDPHTDTLAMLRHRLWADRPAGSTGPAVFAGYLAPPRPVAPEPATEPTGPVVALVGQVVEVPLRPAAVPLDPSPGRHLAVLGPGPAAEDVLDGLVRSLAAQHAPGDVRFVVASLVDEADPTAAALCAELARRHPVDRVDAAGLAGALDLAGPGYLVVFGMDGADPGAVPAKRLRALLRDGPTRGVHLIAWWRGVRRFADQFAAVAEPEPTTSGAPEPDSTEPHGTEPHGTEPHDTEPDGTKSHGMASGDAATIDHLLFLDVPEPEVARLLGRAVRWRPRPGRALLYDRRTDRTSLVVPYATPTGVGAR